MSPEGMKSDWWNRDQSSRQSDTSMLLERQKNAVIEYLDSQGHTGYALGNPTLCGWTFLQIGILDPQVDVPSEILVFAENRKKLDENEKPLEPLTKEQCKYTFDSSTEQYSLEFKIPTSTYKEQAETSYIGEFNARGDILSISEKTEEEV